MYTTFGREHLWTTFVQDRADGFVGLQLHCELDGRTAVVAQVLFWDASGQFFVQTFDRDVPVEILEAVIAEARERVRVR